MEGITYDERSEYSSVSYHAACFVLIVIDSCNTKVGGYLVVDKPSILEPEPKLA